MHERGEDDHGPAERPPNHEHRHTVVGVELVAEAAKNRQLEDDEPESARQQKHAFARRTSACRLVRRSAMLRQVRSDAGQQKECRRDWSRGWDSGFGI